MTARALECSCGAELDVSDARGGDRVTCARCGSEWELPPGVEGVARVEVEDEKAVERDVIRAYRRVGCKVWKTSQPQRAVGMTKGLPDLVVFRGEGPGELPSLWFHEVKPTDDLSEARRRQTDEQEEFEVACGEAGVPYVLGGARPAAEFLQMHMPG